MTGTQTAGDNRVANQRHLTGQDPMKQRNIDWFNFLVVFLMVGIALFLIINFIPSRFLVLPDKGITKLYYADNISAAHQEIIHRFNEKYAGKIEVIPINLPFDRFTTNERKELLARSLRSQNSRIDIFAVDVIWVPRFARWAAPLAEYFTNGEMQGILKEALFTSGYNDSLVSIPLYIDIGLMYYRKDIIRQFPHGDIIESRIKQGVSWNELINWRDKYDPGHEFYVFQGDQYEGIVCQFTELYHSCGGELVTNHTLTLDTAPAERSLNFLVDLIYKYHIVPPGVVSMREGGSYNYAIENDIPFFRGWPGILQGASGYGADSVKVKELGFAPIPHFRGYPSTGVYGGWNLMISRHSTKKDAAAKFIKFALSRESQEILIKLGHYYPVNSAFYRDSTYLKQYPELGYYHTLLSMGTFRPWLENYTEISEILSFYLNKALKRELTPEAALKKAEQTISSKRVFIR